MTAATPRRSVVAVESAANGLRPAIARALATVEWQRIFPKGGDVALKVNLGWDLFIPGSITSPYFLEALIAEIQPHVGRIFVVESDQVLENIESAFERSGAAEVCRRAGATWVNLGRGETVEVDAPGNTILKRIAVPRILREMPFITVPVMKTHAKTGITGSLKNQWGCLPKMRHEYHLVLDDALADLNSVVRPALSIMDATVGLEGNGPKSGWPRIVDAVLCSADPVALDTVQAKMMGVDPATIAHLARAAERGIGTNRLDDIDVRSVETPAPVAPFARARHNAVSVIETLLRKSFLKRLVFNTPLFYLPLAGAKAYYRVWAWLEAGRAWDVACAHPRYGEYWRRLRRPWPTRGGAPGGAPRADSADSAARGGPGSGSAHK